MASSKKILIVEDNGVQAMMLSKLIKKAGYDILGIVDQGEKAINLSLKQPPDLILMDIFLNGDMSGIDAMQRIREKNPDLPVIYISGNSDSYYVSRARKTGCIEFLFKPIDRTDVLGAVAKAFGQKAPTAKKSAEKWAWPFSLFF